MTVILGSMTDQNCKPNQLQSLILYLFVGVSNGSGESEAERARLLMILEVVGTVSRILSRLLYIAFMDKLAPLTRRSQGPS